MFKSSASLTSWIYILKPILALKMTFRRKVTIGVIVLKKLKFHLSVSIRKGSEYLGAQEDEEEKEVESWPDVWQF